MSNMNYFVPPYQATPVAFADAEFVTNNFPDVNNQALTELLSPGPSSSEDNNSDAAMLAQLLVDFPSTESTSDSCGGHVQNSSSSSSSTGLAKRKRKTHTTREPTREDFATEESYMATWLKWRHNRDNNNNAVKKSRENLKRKKLMTEQVSLCKEQQHVGMESELKQLREKVRLLVKAVRNSISLSEQERSNVLSMCEDTALVA